MPGKHSTRRSELPPTNPTELVYYLLVNPKLFLAFLFLVIASVMVLLAVVLALRWFGYDAVGALLPTAVDKHEASAVESEPAQWAARRCENEARKRKSPLVIEHVTLLISLNDRPTGDATFERNLDVRTIYSLRALEKITASQRIFKEQYTTRTGRSVLRWFGTGIEASFKSDIPESRDVTYDVMFDIEKGESRTIVTGARNIDIFPRQTNPLDLTGARIDTPNIDVYLYPNEADYICELMMVVYSSTTKLGSGPRGAQRLDAAGKLSSNLPVMSQISDEGGNELPPEARSVSARWTDLEPHERVSLEYAWTSN